MSTAVYYDLSASVVPLTIEFTTSSGTAVDPTTVQLITTDPAGTQATYTYAGGSGTNVIRKLGVGNYEFDLQASSLYSPNPVPTGLWSAMWIGAGNTGGPGGTTVSPETFRILSYSAAPGTAEVQWYCGLDELKARLSLADNASNYEMTWAIQAATNWISEYCLVPETPVLTADLRWVPVGTLNVGDELIGVDEHPEGPSRPKRRYKRATVTSAPRRMAACTRITLEDGREVISAADHRWLTRSSRNPVYDWARACMIQPGDSICAPLRPWPEEASFDAGWMSGILDGEGWLRSAMPGRGATVGVAQNPGNVLDRMLAYLKEADIPYSITSRAQDNCQRVEIRSRSASMEILGRLQPCRLMPRSAEVWEGGQVGGSLRVVSIEPAGVREVVSLGTSAKTFIANGLVSHNCAQHFYQITESRTYAPDNIWLLNIDPLVSASAFALDYDGDGIFETSWTQGVNYQLRLGTDLYNKNYRGVPRPYTQAQVLLGTPNAPSGGQFFPFIWPFTHLDRVKITGVWGWPAVPPAVSQACVMLAAEYFKLKDATFGVAGVSDLGLVKAGSNSWIVELLRPYIRTSRKAGC